MQTIQGLENGHGENMTVDLTEATLAQDGQLIITGEDGHGKKNKQTFDPILLLQNIIFKFTIRFITPPFRLSSVSQWYDYITRIVIRISDNGSKYSTFAYEQ